MTDIGDYYDVAAIAAQEAQIPVRLLHGCTGAWREGAEEEERRRGEGSIEGGRAATAGEGGAV